MLSEGGIGSAFSTAGSLLVKVFQDILDEHFSGMAYGELLRALERQVEKQPLAGSSTPVSYDFSIEV